MSSAITLYLVVLIFSSCSGARAAPPNKEGFYTIIVPGTIRSESLLHVSIGLSDFHQSCWFNITLSSSPGPNTHQHYGLKTIEIHPNTVKLVELQVPTLDSKRGELEIVGYSGIISRDTADINFEHDSHSVFIQTNKPKYKLGELVQFRVICIDQLTRPAQIDKPISVLIYDSQENLIKQISNVKLVQGVFKGDFQLSDYPVLGEWMIKVEVGGNASAEKSFQVEKYVLPKFLVRILTKPNVAVDENKIVLAISANYFYGEPVKGNVTILLERTHPLMQGELPIFEKESQINEKTSFNLDMKNDLKIENKNNEDRGTSKILNKFNVKAIVTDALTQQQSTTDVEIVVYSQHYKINLQAPKVFVSEEVLKFKVKVSVTDLLEDKLIDSPSSTVKITLECYSSVENLRLDIDSIKTELTHQIGKNYANIKIENQNFEICKLYAEYQGVKSHVEQIKKNEDTFYLEVLTESPEVGKELEVKLKSLDPIEHFSYEIVSRGDIIQSEYINVPEDQTSYTFRFNVTYAMVPKITIYAHRIRKRIFSGQLKEVYIKRVFQNSIKIMTDNEAKPGSSININVTTDEGSYVGLMGLDHRILQNLHDTSYDASSDGLTENHFYTKLRNYDALSIDTSTFPGINAGLITFSNAVTKIGSRFGEAEYDVTSIFSIDTEELLPEPFDKPSLELPRIRKIFSESWLYKDIERTPAGGFNLMETVPDTITSWAITGFSLNPKTGLTLTKNATNLKVFQEFFVSVDLPNLVTEGEIIEVPIYISNYMKQDALTKVIIDKDSEYLEILKQPDTALNPNEAISKLIPARMRAKIQVFMKPLKAGQFNVTVKAIAPMMASDAVQKTLNVKSEGIPYEFSNTYSIHLPEDGTQENDITVDIPEQAVPGSQSVEISIVGDIFGPLLRSLQKMARVPYGNGEENMRFVISNLLVLKYLKALNYTFPSLESKIKLNLELGYQNQLCFKHLDGSFGIFDRTIERSGDIWQTAFALWGLKQSKNFIHVDTKVFERGLNYLKTRQQENGCFKSKSGIEEDIEYTAFSLMVFLMDNHWKTTHFEVISKGLKYLSEMSDSLGQSSISVLSTYVLLLGRHEKAGDFLKKLSADKLLTSTSKQMFWKKSDNLQSHLETTADSLMILFESQKNPRQNLLHITRGLITSEDGKSSLTHIIALHSLLVFVEDLNLSRKNLTTFFSDDQKGSGNFQVNSGNSQVLQKLKLSKKSRSIHLQSKGYGFAVVDVKYKYNLVIENQSSSAYATNITTTPRSSNSLANFEVCASGLKNMNENYLTVMEVTLQSGYIFTEKITPQVGLTWKFKSLKVNDNQDKLVVYIANLNKNGICLKLECLEKYKVLNAKPGWVVLYDVHKKGEKSAKSFKIHDN